jgi:hypothetical protein
MERMPVGGGGAPPTVPPHQLPPSLFGYVDGSNTFIFWLKTESFFDSLKE